MPEDPSTSPPTAANARAIGWYGKLPATGDFVTRRLPASFVQPWDRWLQEGLVRSRALLGDRWQALYLTFPVWRFVIPAGVLDPSAWCGTLLPSVDRVGRCFPLTICRPLAPLSAAQASLICVDRELDQFAQAGLIGLDGVPMEEFDQAVCAIAPPGAEPGTPGPANADLALEAFCEPSQTARWLLAPSLEPVLAGSAARLALTKLAQRSLWWSPSNEDSPGRLWLESPPLGPDLLPALIGSE